MAGQELRVPVNLSEDRDPWERQPKEPKTAYYFFSLYRDLLPHERSVRKVAEQTSRSPRTLTGYCHIWRWTDRAEAWDASLDLERRAAAKQAILDMDRRHAQMASLMLSKVAQRLLGDPTAGIDAIDPSRLSASDLARLAEVGTKVERIARGADKEQLDSAEGIRLKVAFEFSPTYPEERQSDVELPPDEYRELEENATPVDSES